MTTWLPLLGLALTVGAPGVKEIPKKAEPPGIVGEWTVEEVVRGGMAFPGIATEGMSIEFKTDGKYHLRIKGQNAKDGTYTTTPGKDASEIDMNSGAEQAPGLFKVEKDKLTLCIDDGGKGATRPAGFESPAGSRVMLMTLKRVEKKKE
jgi:uncharacterized protein (TIGR03067 family)